jgi:hypothetical protein
MQAFFTAFFPSGFDVFAIFLHFEDFGVDLLVCFWLNGIVEI